MITMEENNMEVIEKMIEPLAWDKLSEDFGWTEELLEKCRDQVNWQKISQNNNIACNTSMLEKFKDELDWNELSGYGDTRLFTMEHLERFKEYWNWSSLSGNGSINWSRTLLERFADKWDWEKIINNWQLLDRLFYLEFMSRYQKYIPFAALRNSNLEEKLVEELKNELIDELMS